MSGFRISKSLESMCFAVIHSDNHHISFWGLNLFRLLVLLTILGAGLLYAQEEPQSRVNQRSLGDQSINISAGLSVPLKTTLLKNPAGFSSGGTDSRISVGGTGILTYGFYLQPQVKLGLQLKGSFMRDINRNFLNLYSISFKGAYELQPTGRITIPLHLAVGIDFTDWKDEVVIDPVIRPGVGIYFDSDAEWSFGVDMMYSMIPQLKTADKQFSAIGNFIDIVLAAEYHFQ